jgi:hypothetical protein
MHSAPPTSARAAPPPPPPTLAPAPEAPRRWAWLKTTLPILLSAVALLLSVWTTREGNERIDRDATTDDIRRFRDNIARVTELRGDAARQGDPNSAAYQEEMTLRMQEAAVLAVSLDDELSVSDQAVTAYLLADVGDPRAIEVAHQAVSQPMDDRTRLDVLPVVAMVEFRFANSTDARSHMQEAVDLAATVAATMDVEDIDAVRNEIVAMALARWATAEATFGDCGEAHRILDEATPHVEGLGLAAQQLFAAQATGLDALPACA